MKNYNQNEVLEDVGFRWTDKQSKPQNKCHVCKKKIVQLETLEKHEALHENSESKKNPPQCTVCGWFPIQKDLWHNITSIQFVYFLTGEQTKHINHYKIHMTLKVIYLYTSEIILDEWRTLRVLTHLRKHTGERPCYLVSAKYLKFYFFLQ